MAGNAYRKSLLYILSLAVDMPFAVNSIYGSNKIKNKCLMKIFGQVSLCFLVDMLSSFDAIVERY